FESLSHTIMSEIPREGRPGGDGFQTPALTPELEDIGGRQVPLINTKLRVIAPYPDQSLRTIIGQGAQENGADDAENSRIGADAERQHDHGDRCKRGAAAKRANRVAKILDYLFEPDPSPHGSSGFLHQTHIAELASRVGLGLASGLAAFDAVAGRHFEMALDLFFQLIVPPAAPGPW